MRTTIDLPDELFRRAKVRAAQDGLRFKDLIRRYVEQGLRDRTPDAATAPRRQRSELPVARGVTGNLLPALTNADVERILGEEDVEATLTHGD